MSMVVVLTASRRSPKMFLKKMFYFCLYFGQNAYQNALVSWNVPCPKKVLVACLHSAFIHFVKPFILNFWQCCECASFTINVQEFVQWRYSMYCITHSLFGHIVRILFIQMHADTFKHIQCVKAHSCILRHY